MARDADVLVVGSGPLGAVAARRLAERGARVLMLEEGSGSGEHLRNQERFRRRPDAFLPAALAACELPCAGADAHSGLPGAPITRAVGGQSILWTNNCPRPAEHERWCGVSRDEWDAALSAAEALLGVVGDLFPGSARQERVKAAVVRHLSGSERRVRSLPIAAHRDVGGALHYHATADILAAAQPPAARRITLEPRCRVDRLWLERGRVAGVEAQTSAGSRRFEAPALIVAGGALGTPALLWASGVRPAALGRGVTFHPVLLAQLILRDDLARPSDAPGDLPRLWIPPTPQHPWHTMLLRDISPDPPPPERADPARLLEIQMFCPLEPRPEHRLSIDERGGYAFDVRLSDSARATTHRMRDDLLALASALGRFRLGGEPQSMPPGFAHLMGTCRMGRSEADGVADPLGRVWGIDGLYLATLGLIPNAVAVNPTLTGAALAVRTADAIAG